MGKLLVGLLVGSLALMAWAAVATAGSQHRFNTWTSDCIRAKGQISQTHEGFASKRYECFVNGKIVTLPGWEGY